jgi:ribose transport system permease protein
MTLSHSIPHAKDGRNNSLRLMAEGSVLIVIVFLILYGINVWQQPRSLSFSAFANLSNNAAPLAIAAAGQTLVVLSRGFDLSLAGVVSLTNVIMAVYPMQGPGGALLSLGLCLLIGATVGAVNGWLVAKLRLQAIAATLATMIICQGIALVILDAPGGMVSDWVAYQLTDRIWGIVPVSSIVLLVVIAIWMIIRRTDFGVSLYAVGEDEGAARLSGISVIGARFYAFVGAGMLYGLSGYMLSAQTATGNPSAGIPLLMLAFAAVALGGTSFSGGKGGIFASIIGAFTLVLLQKVLFSSGVASFYTGIFQGVVLILAVVFSQLLTRLGRRGA